MDEHSARIRDRYNRVASIFDIMSGAMELMIKNAYLEQVLGRVRGKVLEVGVGTGRNLPLYPPGVEVTGIDFSPRMLAKAKEKAAKAQAQVTLVEMDAQNMSFPDQTFDTVITTCVFCSVPNPIKGLQEIRRVLKPDGRLVMLEHVRSENPILGKVMDLVNPLVVGTFGANINRRTVENVQAAGLTIEKVDLLSHIMRLIVAKP